MKAQCRCCYATYQLEEADKGKVELHYDGSAIGKCYHCDAPIIFTRPIKVRERKSR
jgi:hypothetical protein